MTNAAERDLSAEIRIQREYYARSANQYDSMHVDGSIEHNFALQFMMGVVRHLGVRSILDLGSGTGRALLKIKSELPGIKILGLEPSAELRGVGHAKGLSETELVGGDAMNLAYGDGSFDLACEFGALHHIPVPSKAVSEMLRVSRRAIFISDTNNFGHGSGLARLTKQAFNALGLWPLVDKIKTKGKGYTISEGDGLAYSYSVFNDFMQVRNACASLHMLNTLDGGPNLYRTASHVALLGIKQPMNAMAD
jgi:ubiquinone/menaquinone biosynthesis C-methylase UbiE